MGGKTKLEAIDDDEPAPTKPGCPIAEYDAAWARIVKSPDRMPCGRKRVHGSHLTKAQRVQRRCRLASTTKPAVEELAERVAKRGD